MFAFDTDADASAVRPAPAETLSGSALLDRLRDRAQEGESGLACALRETAAQALTLGAERLDVARALGARLDRSRGARRATLPRAARVGAAVVSWTDAEGEPCAVSLPRPIAWRVRDGLEAQGVRAAITFNCPQ